VNGERPCAYRVERESVARNLPGASRSGRSHRGCPQTGYRVTGCYLRSGEGLFAHRQACAHQQHL
jgi:hypothetical protein